jgi:hypothetical protein
MVRPMVDSIKITPLTRFDHKINKYATLALMPLDGSYVYVDIVIREVGFDGRR